MSVAFADAFYFVALLNVRDQHHEAAVSYSKAFHGRIVTSDWVLVEVADALGASQCRPRIFAFFSHLRNWPSCEVVAADRGLLDKALQMYHGHADKKWTLTDCTSFVVMRERGIKEALTADHHFEQAGFVRLIK
jgi:uncharacterized protein